MSESKELKKIKKIYGENFMKMCRDFFPTLLEQEGRLYEILSSSFSKNCKTLYADIIDNELEDSFKDYIYSKVDVEDQEKKMIIEKTPYELLKEAGYDLKECLTEKEIQEFKKYYEFSEELCTFRGGRLKKCVVFFAVKEDAEAIKRKDFKNPKREDKYGTSVMGIQFNRTGKCTVSIKNRYNHTVNNPDATYGNDLDRITPGLTKSFSTLLKKEYGLELNNSNIEEFEIPGYVVANDGKYYKYNMEIDGDYYCPGNIVIKQGGEVRSIGNPEEGLLIDYFYIDRRKKTIEVCPDIEDAFVNDLQEIEKIEVVKSKAENVDRVVKIYIKDIEEPALIEIDKNNQIVKYKNNNITKIGDNFLYYNKVLTKLKAPNLKQVGDGFLGWNEVLTELEIPNLEQVGDDFLRWNEVLRELEIPKLKKVGDDFLYYNKVLTKLKASNLKQVGDDFLRWNEVLRELEIPKLKKVGDGFLYDNKALTELEIPNLEQVGDGFLYNNEVLTELKAPKLKKVGDDFLGWNEVLTELEIPNLKQVGDDFLGWNKVLTELEIPNLEQVGDGFLYNNKVLTKLKAPNLEQVGGGFLYNNEVLTEPKAPKLMKVGNDANELIKKKMKQNKNKKTLTPKDIAQLDKENKLTTSEISIVHKLIRKILNKRELNK